MGVWAHPNISHLRIDEQVWDAPELGNEYVYPYMDTCLYSIYIDLSMYDEFGRSRKLKSVFLCPTHSPSKV